MMWADLLSCSSANWWPSICLEKSVFAGLDGHYWSPNMVCNEKEVKEPAPTGRGKPCLYGEPITSLECQHEPLFDLTE